MSNLGYDANGIPVLSLKEKIEALQYCFDHDAHEAALGHLGDLFHYALEHFNKGMVDQGDDPWTIRIGAEHFIISPTPTPINGPSVLDRIVRKLGESE